MPDILNECLYELRWLMKMQVAGIDTKLLLMIGLGVFLISVIILYFVMRKKKEGKK